MKNGRSLAAALAISMLAPLPLLAQGGGQGSRGGMGAMSARLLVEQGSVEYLVTKAADLELTPGQTTQLEAIGRKWAASTTDSRAEIRGILPQPGQAAATDREARMQRMQALRPLVEKLAEEDTKALNEALALLDEAQRTKVKALLDERLQNARPRRGGGRS